MAKKNPDLDHHAKNSIATNLMFKETGKAALCHINSRHKKDGIEKPAKTLKRKKGHKLKHVAKDIPEHTLAADFAGKICLN